MKPLASRPTVVSVTEEITTAEQLRAVVGEPVRRAVVKQRDRLDDTDRAFIARSPFQMIATRARDGRVDVSPKGDPAGSVLVLDDRTLAVPDRPGNRRVDGFLNILENPHVGLIFLVPRRSDTLRVNGTARIVRNPPYAEAMSHAGTCPTSSSRSPSRRSSPTARRRSCARTSGSPSAGPTTTCRASRRWPPAPPTT